MSHSADNDKYRMWVHLLLNHPVAGKSLNSRAKLTKRNINAMLRKSSDAPFCEPGSGDKVDNNTLRVLLYKLCRAAGPVSLCAEACQVSSAELKQVLDSVRDQVENLVE